MTTFKDYPLQAPIAKALESLGFTNPTEIQQKALQHLLTADKVDFHGQAQTGTGKTLAFGIPLIQSIDPKNNATQALIVAPTRELCAQICDSLKAAARFTSVSIEPIYGGVSMQGQMRALKKGVHIIVGTPGRLNDHLRRKTLVLKGLRTLVLDEADIMLDMGFKEEIDEILQYTPDDRQLWLFSATVKAGIQKLKTDQMKNPITVRTAAQDTTITTTKQYYCVAPKKYKLQAVARFIETAIDFYGVIFCQTKILANEVAQVLNSAGFPADALHGDMSQALRDKVMQSFRDKKFTVLVATDVAARGIDVANLTHVLNYSLPEDQDSYVHRIGRTGRAGKEGIAITFLSDYQVNMFKSLARRFKAQVEMIQIPTAHDVTAIRVEKVKVQLDTFCTKPMATHPGAQQLKQLLEQRSAQELMMGMHNLLTSTILKGFDKEPAELNMPEADMREPRGRGSRGGDRFGGRSFDRDRSDRGDNGRYERTGGRREQRGGGNGSGIEIMLDIGAESGFDKKDVLRYVAGAPSMHGASIGNINVIKTRSFVMVPNHLSQQLIKELHGKELRGRTVRVQLA